MARGRVSRLGGPLGLSAALHLAAAAVLLVVRPEPPPPLPPIYRVDLVAAPPGPRAAGVVTPAPPAAAPKAVPDPTPKAPMPPPRAETKPTDVPPPPAKRPAPARTPPPPATPSPPATRRPAAPAADPGKGTADAGKGTAAAPQAGGGPTGGRGTDVATVRTVGIEFPYPGYLNNIVRQIALNFHPGNPNAPLRAEVAFLIHRDGSISALRFVTRSGSYAFDLEAQGAIEAAGATGAFGPLPDGYPDDVLPVVFSFDPRVLR